MASALREWQTSQQELRKRLNQLAQCLRDHATSGGEGDADWQEDEELVEGELMCLLASGERGRTAYPLRFTGDAGWQGGHMAAPVRGWQ